MVPPPFFIYSYEHMNTVTTLAQELARFRSTHTNPKEMLACLEHCISFFDGVGVHIARHEHENIPSVVISNGEAKHFDVLFVAHIDTVDGSDELFEGRIEEGKLFGRGTLDMKAFVATSLVVVRELIEEGFTGSIGVAVVTDEELGGVHGARHLVEDIGYTADTVLVPDDGEDVGTIIARTKHILQVRFDALGKESHACRPWDGVNAIRMLQSTYDALEESVQVLEPSRSSNPNSTWVNSINLGTITGGLATNEVPEKASMTVDIRFVPPVTRKVIEHILATSCVEGVSYIVTLEGPPTQIDTDDEVVKVYSDAIKNNIGREPLFEGSGGGTDARYFAYAGMRAIVHQGNGGDAQGGTEHVEVESLEALVKIQKEFITRQYQK